MRYAKSGEGEGEENRCNKYGRAVTLVVLSYYNVQRFERFDLN